MRVAGTRRVAMVGLALLLSSIFLGFAWTDYLAAVSTFNEAVSSRIECDQLCRRIAAQKTDDLRPFAFAEGDFQPGSGVESACREAGITTGSLTVTTGSARKLGESDLEEVSVDIPASVEMTLEQLVRFIDAASRSKPALIVKRVVLVPDLRPREESSESEQEGRWLATLELSFLKKKASLGK
jgi:hypothetical protein